jgi:hypothetical protein
MEVKDATKAAAKSGDLAMPGESVLHGVTEKKPVTHKSRMEVKEEVKKAEENMTLNKAGEKIKPGQ